MKKELRILKNSQIILKIKFSQDLVNISMTQLWLLIQKLTISHSLMLSELIRIEKYLCQIQFKCQTSKIRALALISKTKKTGQLSLTPQIWCLRLQRCFMDREFIMGTIQVPLIMKLVISKPLLILWSRVEVAQITQWLCKSSPRCSWRKLWTHLTTQWGLMRTQSLSKPLISAPGTTRPRIMPSRGQILKRVGTICTLPCPIPKPVETLASNNSWTQQCSTLVLVMLNKL